jgi:hypothetical protein
MNDLEFRVLTQKEAHLLETTSHNPPTYSDGFTEEDFRREWWSVCDRLAARLEIFGDPWTLDHQTGDYTLPEASGPYRWIYINFCSTRLWRPEFVAAIADFLRDTPQDYRIACLTELTDTADPDFEEPVVYLVISANSVEGKAAHPRLDADGAVISTPANEVLVRFGFSPSLVFNDATHVA